MQCHRVNDSDERLVKHLMEAVCANTAAVAANTAAIQSAANLVTRCDLAAMEARIVKALGERVNPKDLEKLSTKLEAATAPLEKAVAENQPG